ncbi:MAG TPA: penicillin-binding protein 2 [Gammaproteobacteria bacterium]|nr:penicillin-binding protein 2 [Gammaproteobacteria bacterium]
MSGDRLKDSAGDGRVIRWRLLMGLVGVLALTGVLGGRLAWLQVIGYQHYSTLSQNNRVRLVAIPPTRGLIYDRNGVLLAENVPAHRLVITPEQVDDMDQTLKRLSKIVDLRPTDLERFHDLLRQQRRFQEIPLKLQLTEREVARLAVNRHRFPGVEVKSHLIRRYPLGSEAVHAIGYVGRINERELRQVDASEYQGSSHIGKTGIERYYEKALHGHVGVKRVETNARGRVVRTLDRTPPVPGKDIYLTLDMRLQQAAEKALGDNSGAIVAIDPRNGEVLAMVSKPAFDPNLFVNGISLEDYRALQTGKDNPLFNRVTRGQYPPGSTVKPFYGLAGLELGIRKADDVIDCHGSYSIPGVDHRWRDWKRWGHGPVKLKQAIAQSCDVYFYGLAYKMGINAMHDFMTPFGFGRRTGVDLPGELTGVMPSKAWKRRERGKPWYNGETVIAGIGQGFTTATPLQLAYATALMADDGKKIAPHLRRMTRAPGADRPQLDPPAIPKKDDAIKLKHPEHWDEIHKAMQAVIYSPKGTARALNDSAYRVAGKTGTAQVFGLGSNETYKADEVPKELRDHALFVAFAPADNPRIAVSVVVEHGGSSHTAVPIAGKVMDAWLLKYGGQDATGGK